MDLEGRLLGNRYEIIEKVGNGGMATVYKAKCHVLNRYVAVKILKEEFTTDEEFIKRFNTEAQAAASLTHPNIVSVYDVGSEGDLHYIVMELVKGKTLKEIINEDGALSWKWSVNVAIQIASALETAHKNNIIHRDIKPHNIIITEDGIAKVTDFGIAKAVSNSTITAFGTTMGSVHYFSPEHARGGYTDAKSDLYSLGVVLYEMVTGKVPFNADTPVSVALKHMQETPKQPIEVNPSIPKAVNDIIMKAMQKDVNLRYQNATEMLKDLSKAIKNPNSEFVVMEKQEDFPTQRISTIYDKSDFNNKSDFKNKKEEKGLKAFVNKHKAICIIVGAILLLAITILVTNIIIDKTAVKDAQIPNLIGKEQSQAESEAKESKFKLEVTGQAFDKDVPLGCIISQDPAYIPNYKIKEGTTIKVVVSKGKNTVEMIKVNGLTKDDAVAKLMALDLKVEVVEEFDKKVEAGYVIDQSVGEGQEIDAGETITIKVSKGIEKVVVPDLTGKTEAEAKKMISDKGLKLKKVYVDNDESKADGVVLYQDLEVDSEVEKDSYISITINQLLQKKKGTINVNVKSLLNGKVEYEDPTTNEAVGQQVVKKVKLKITVNDESIFDKEVDPRSESISTEFTNKGYVSIKVLIDGVKKADTGINLEDTNICIID